MKVIILPSGTEAREVQTIDSKDFKRWLSTCEKKRKSGDTYYVFEAELVTKNEAFGQWCNTQAAEEKCRTFEIETAYGKEYPFRPLDGTGDKYYFEAGSIHEAIELPNGKIRIIT